MGNGKELKSDPFMFDAPGAKCMDLRTAYCENHVEDYSSWFLEFHPTHDRPAITNSDAKNTENLVNVNSINTQQQIATSSSSIPGGPARLARKDKIVSQNTVSQQQPVKKITQKVESSHKGVKREATMEVLTHQS